MVNKSLRFYYIFLICSIVSTSVTFVFSSRVSHAHGRFTKRDCYKSSGVAVYLELAHNFPTGPKYLRVKTRFELDQQDDSSSPIDLSAEIHLIKTDEPCRESLVFSTNGIAFKQMRISIDLYNGFDDDELFAESAYTFDADFHHGSMHFLDMNSHFGLTVKVLTEKRAHLQVSPDSKSGAITKLDSLPRFSGELCIVTENNPEVVVRPTFIHTPPIGYLTHIMAFFSEGDRVVEWVRFPAFECHTQQTNPSEMVIFVEDYSPKVTLSFQAYFTLSDETKDDAGFKIPDAEHVDYKYSLRMLRHFKKVFLMQRNIQRRTCGDGTERTKYVSVSGKTYFSKELKELEVSRGVKHKQWVSHSPLADCDV